MTLPALRDETEDKPLDPAFEKVRRKMVRLLVVSIGVMLAGLMAVLFAIVYRIGLAAPSAPATVAVQPFAQRTGTIRLPKGAAVLSQALSGAQLALHLRLADGAETIVLYDTVADRIVGRYAIAAE